MRPKVAWVTNAPAPYRLPVWEHMGREIDLEVLLLRTQRQFAAAPGNRGAEWARIEPRGYTMRELPTLGFTRRGGALGFVTRPFALRLPSDTTAVVIGGWDTPSYLQALFAAKRRAIGTVGFYESTLMSQAHHEGPVAALRRSFFKGLDAVVVPGKAAEDAVRAMELPRLEIFRGFNAVDVRGIHERVQAARASAVEPAAGHRFLYLGQLIERKNVRAAIEAFASIARPGDSFTLTGKGELRDELESLRTPGVEFTGAVAYDELPGLLARHDTLVLPSQVEVWGLVVNEALAGGLHVVVSDRCGVAPSVQGMAGVTVVPPTVEGLRDGLAESRRAWHGPVGSPEILAHGPEAFARTFLDAISYAASRHPNRRARAERAGTD